MAAAISASQAHTLRWIEHTLYQHFLTHGYLGLDLPTIHPATVFLTRAGDTIIERLFTFDRGEQLALRPEFTALAAHHYARKHSGEIVRWQFSGPIFEDTRLGSQQSYQAWSFGAELIGQVDFSSEAEIIAMAVSGLRNLGIEDVQITTGHVGLMRACLQHYHLDHQTQRLLLTMRDTLLEDDGKERVLAQLANVLPLPDGRNNEAIQRTLITSGMFSDSHSGEAVGTRTPQEIVLRLQNKYQRADQYEAIGGALNLLNRWVRLQGKPSEMLPLLSEIALEHDHDADEVFADWKQTLELLKNLGIGSSQIWIQPNITRHWEYYTGLVFQIVKDGVLLASGGRYDDLIQVLGGKPAPAFGFAYYAPALLSVASTQNPPRTWQLSGQVDARHQMGKWADALRQQGVSVVIDWTSDTSELKVAGETLYWQGRSYAQIDLVALASQLKAIAR